MDRFKVVYRLEASDEADALARADAIAIEDTVEIPRDVIPVGYIEDVVLGRVEQVSANSNGTWTAEISYHIDAVGREFPQLINVILGNASILRGVKAIKLTPNQDVLDRFPGARFGIKGLRERLGRPIGGLVAPVIKPQGSSSERLAELCFTTARAGADIVKEDHGLANQDAAPFRERVARCAEAVARANAIRRAEGDTSQAQFFASIGGHADEVVELAHFAKEVGAHGVLLIPGILGFGTMERLARDDGFGLPIMAHPSHLGSYVLSADTGYAHGLLFGELMRAAGADISVFPNEGGRFGFSIAECTEIVEACRNPSGHGRPILPSPGGGMSVERLPAMRSLYGDDCVYLLGGSLLRYGDKLGEVISDMKRLLIAEQQYQ